MKSSAPTEIYTLDNILSLPGAPPISQCRPLTQARVRERAAEPRMILLCGRYESVVERLLAAEVDEEVSIGDYVLSGGELAAAVVVDAVARLQEGALKDRKSTRLNSSH